jgi:hypothetical protein
MKKKLLFFCFSFLLLTYTTHTQAQDKKDKLENFDIDAFIQSLFAVPDENVNYADAYETLFQLYTNPLDLNEVDREELKSLYVLSEIHINNFLTYREKNGKLLSIYELQAIDGFDNELIKKILPFVTIDESNFSQDSRSLWKRILAEENRFLMMRFERDLELRKGYKTLSAADTNSSGQPLTRYSGNPNKYYIRFRSSHTKDFSVGFTAETDAGEAFNFDKKVGFDFTSFHVAVYNRKKIKAFLVGDYQIQIGQGLLLSGGFGVGKGAETVLTVRRSTLGIRPYSSVLETGFFRGAAMTYQLSKRFVATPFVSYRNQDANLRLDALDSLSDSEADAFANSVIATGFHRTNSELNNKNKLQELTFGTSIVYRSKNQNLELGATFMQTNFSNAVVRLPKSYNQYEFSGNSNTNIGGHYSYNWRNFNFFGEGARSSSGGIGLVSGFIAALTTKVDISFVHRRYDKDFHTFYGNAFSENTRNINEQGTYWGIKIKPIKKITIAAYFDTFAFPWLKFLVDAPSQGYEYLLRFNYQPNRTMQLYAQFREENKGRNLSGSSSIIDFVVPSVKRNLIFNADWTVKEGIFLRSRVQLSSYQQENQKMTTGFAIAQDAVFDYKNFKFSTRFAIFDTDDFNNRQYMFEKNVLYAFSIPAYFGVGFRNYYLVEYKFGKKVSFWLRYAYTVYRKTNTISSGLEQINGNMQSEIVTQVIWKL